MILCHKVELWPRPLAETVRQIHPFIVREILLLLSQLFWPPTSGRRTSPALPFGVLCKTPVSDELLIPGLEKGWRPSDPWSTEERRVRSSPRPWWCGHKTAGLCLIASHPFKIPKGSVTMTVTRKPGPVALCPLKVQFSLAPVYPLILYMSASRNFWLELLNAGDRAYYFWKDDCGVGYRARKDTYRVPWTLDRCCLCGTWCPVSLVSWYTIW